MKVIDNIYFYKGDYKLNTIKAHDIYRGIGSSNFLVIKKNKQILIDSGFPYGPHFTRNEKELTKDNINLMDTSSIIFSHFHPDHIKYGKNLSKYKTMDLLIHKESEKFIQSDWYCFSEYFNYPKFIRNEVMSLPVPLAQAVLYSLGFNLGSLKVSRFFNDDEQILDDPIARTISLYSHCPGHVGFYFPEYKLLYGADLIVPVEGEICLMPSINNACSSLKMALEDINKVKELDIDIFIPGHGEIVSGKENIRNMFAQVEEEVGKVLDIITDTVQNNKGTTLSEITKVIFIKDYVCNYLHGKAMVYNFLSYLYETGKVKYRVKDSKAFWYI